MQNKVTFKESRIEENLKQTVEIRQTSKNFSITVKSLIFTCKQTNKEIQFFVIPDLRLGNWYIPVAQKIRQSLSGRIYHTGQNLVGVLLWHLIHWLQHEFVRATPKPGCLSLVSRAAEGPNRYRSVCQTGVLSSDWQPGNLSGI